MTAESASGPRDYRTPCLPNENSSTDDCSATDKITQSETRKPAICRGMIAESWPSPASLGSASANTRTPVYAQPSSHVQHTAYASPGGPSAPTTPTPSSSGFKTP